MAKKLYSAEQYIKKTNGFKSYIIKIKKSDDFNLVKERLIEALDIMMFHLEDLYLSTDSRYRRILETHKTLVQSFINTINTANELDDLITVTSLLDLLNLDELKDIDEYRLESNAYDLEYNDYEGFYLNEAYVKALRKTINNGAINCFFPNCFNATNARLFSEENDLTYGQMCYTVFER